MKNSLFAPILFLFFLPVASAAQSPEPSIASRLEKHVAILASDSLEGRGLGTEGKLKARDYIAEHFQSFGLQPVNEDYFQNLDLRIGLARVPGTNVIGYLPGSDAALRGEYIVLGAHYDHLGYEYQNDERVIYPGADDNASGTAVLIEMARYFSKNQETIGRSIIFIAFDAEESGLMGSQKFIGDNEVFDTEDIKTMFSLDMVGMYEANNGLNLLGIGTLDGGDVLAREVAEAEGIRLKRTTDDIEPRTDTRPFGNEGIPAIAAFTGTKSPYHKPEDTYDLLDYEGMARITEYLQALVTKMSVLPELSPSHRFARLQQPYALRFNAGVLGHIGGTHHRYPDEFFRANNVFAFSAGLFIQMHVGRTFSLQPEILYDYNGSQSAEGTYRRHSITFPVNLNYYIAGNPGGMFRAYPIAGGYFRFNMAGKDGDADLNFDTLHPGQEWGINAGFGLEIMKVHVAYIWQRGLTNISAIPDTNMFNIGRYLKIGYSF